MTSFDSSYSPFDSPEPLPFWLPPLHKRDWQVRYLTGLTLLWEAERGLRELRQRFRELQIGFEMGELPSQFTPAPVEPDGAASRSLQEDENIVLEPWTWQDEADLGMVGLTPWVSVKPLQPDPDPNPLGNIPLAHLFMQIAYDPPSELTLQKRTERLFQEAMRHFMLLVIEQPKDVMALYYRARTQKGVASLLRLFMLPLAQQPAVYDQEKYVKAINNSFDDLNELIFLLNESLADDEEGGRPHDLGTLTQQSQIKWLLYEGYLMLYQHFWNQNLWGQAYHPLCNALYLKPSIRLYLARAELSYRLGDLQLVAADLEESLTLVHGQIPEYQRPEFERNLERIRLELSSGTGVEAIRRVMEFWQANPMLIV